MSEHKIVIGFKSQKTMTPKAHLFIDNSDNPVFFPKSRTSVFSSNGEGGLIDRAIVPLWLLNKKREKEPELNFTVWQIEDYERQEGFIGKAEPEPRAHEKKEEVLDRADKLLAACQTDMDDEWGSW